MRYAIVLMDDHGYAFEFGTFDRKANCDPQPGCWRATFAAAAAGP